MGFDAQLSDLFEFDVTAFYKDVFDLSGVRTVHALPQPYTMYYNVEYARIQGFEATVSKTLNQYWSSRLGYTFQIAKGTASTAETQYQSSTPRQLDYFLDQDQRHAFHGDLAFSFPPDFGFVPMRDFDVSGVFNYGSGLPYTPTDQKGNQIGLSNSGRLPGSYTLDSRLSKDFTIAGLSLSINCDITNVLNSEIITDVFDATGKPDYTGRVITPDQFKQPSDANYVRFGDAAYHPARDYDHDGYLSYMEMYASYLRAYTDANNYPTYYGPPRKIKVGLSLSF